MGASHGDFIKYPRTPHFFGSKGTDDDKHLGEAESQRFITDGSLSQVPVVEIHRSASWTGGKLPLWQKRVVSGSF